MSRADELSPLLKRLEASPSDEHAWSSLYRLMWPFVVAAVCRRLRGANRQIAQDAAQEVFARLLAFPPFERVWEADAFRGYLWTMADNVAKTYVRNVLTDEQRKAVIQNEGVNAYLDPGEAEKGLIFEQDIAQVKSVLEPKEFELFGLLIKGFSIGDIAEKLGLSYSVVGVRLHRMRRKLHKLLNLQ
jgi:RNA polymerase sigma factor (sigma-70 family)